MVEQLLPQTVDRIVEQLTRFLADKTVTPGFIGKQAFVGRVLDRTNFFHPDVYREIKTSRGSKPQKTYLLEHDPIYAVVGQYV